MKSVPIRVIRGFRSWSDNQLLPGIVVAADLAFAKVIPPLAAELAHCFWFIGHQSGGPFDSLYVEANAALFEKQRLDVAVLAYRSAVVPDSWVSCWRPHTFPRLAERVRLDEWTRFWGLRCTEADVPDRVRWLDAHPDLTPESFAHADILLIWPAGWWEIYTPHAAWRRKFRQAFPQSYERSWRKAGEPPTDFW